MRHVFPLLLALLAGAAAARAQTPPPEPAPAQTAAESTAQADITGAPLQLRVATLDHGDFDLAEQRGHWVVANFWATWCTPCLKEIPDLTAFAAARDDVRVLGLAYEDIAPDAMRDFMREHPIGYPVAIVDVYDPPKAFDPPRGLPMTYLVGPDGAVAKRFLGPVTSKELAAAIAAASPSAP